MAKLTLNTILSGFQSVTILNSNFDDIEDEFQNKVLYRDNPTGEPNTMQCDIDMNGYNILNLGNSTVLASASVTQAVSWGTQFDGTGTHTVTTSHVYRNTEVSASSSVTACIAITTEAVGGWASGQWIGLIQKGLGPIKVVGNAGVTVNEESAAASQYSRKVAWYAGSNTWYVS